MNHAEVASLLKSRGGKFLSSQAHNAFFDP